MLWCLLAIWSPSELAVSCLERERSCCILSSGGETGQAANCPKTTSPIPTPNPPSLKSYHRVPIKHGDYPAVIKGSTSDQVDGFLSFPASASQLKKMNGFWREGVSSWVLTDLSDGMQYYSCCRGISLGWRDGEARFRRVVFRILKRISCRIGWNLLMGWRWLGKVGSTFILTCLVLLLTQLL